MITKAQILGQIKTIGNRGVGLDKLIQETALAVVAHMAEHKEASLACKLYLAMPKGSRALALAHWFHKFGSVTVNKGSDHKTIPFKFNMEGTVDLEGGRNKAWFDCKKERDLKDEQFDLDAKLYALQAYIRKAQESGKVTEVDPRIAALLALEVKKPTKAAA